MNTFLHEVEVVDVKISAFRFKKKKLEFAYGTASSYEPSIRQGGLKQSFTAQIIHSSFSVKRFETLE